MNILIQIISLKRLNLSFILLLGITMYLLSGCGRKVAGGETSGSENGNAFSGVIFDEDGKVADSVEVIITPANNRPSLISTTNTYKDTTDEKGNYTVIIPDSGLFNLMAVHLNNGDVTIIRNIPVISDLDTLPDQIIIKPGIIIIPVPNHSSEGQVYIKGTNIEKEIPPQGEIILSVPAHDSIDIYYKLNGDSVEYLLVGELVVESGKTIRFDSLIFWRELQEIKLKISNLNISNEDTLQNFPLLLRIHDTLTEGFDEEGVNLRILDTAGKILSYQIESWEFGKDEKLIWVKVPNLYSKQDFQMRIYLETRLSGIETYTHTGVFDSSSGFIGVWHLDESPTGIQDEIKDQSPYDHHGLTHGNMNTNNSVKGAIGSALNFNGIDQYIDMDTIKGPIGERSPLTLSAWVKVDSYSSDCTNNWEVIAGVRNEEVGNFYKLQKCDSSWVFEYDPFSNFTEMVKGGIVPLNKWNYVSAVFDGRFASLYENGIQVDTSVMVSDSSRIQSRQFHIGNRSDDLSEFFKGTIDEVRLESDPRSEFWIRLCYETQNTNPQILEWRKIR